MTELLSSSDLSPASRPPDLTVAAASDARPVLTWREFVVSLDELYRELDGRPEKRWALHTEDHILFLLGLFALLLCGKEIHLPPLGPRDGTLFETDPLPFASDTPGSAVTLRLCRRIDGPVEPSSWPRINPESATIIFHTSGSTGAPKLVPKNLIQIENEIAVLAALWQDRIRGATVFSTVSPLHFYGFLFTALLPFSLGACISAERVRFPEACVRLSGRPAVLVTSPAFLKRCADGEAFERPMPPPRLIFSSGGFLPESTARCCKELFGAPVHEIYGSTETGGIAWRVSPPDNSAATEEKAWVLFPGVSVAEIDAAGFTVASSYLPPPGSMRIEDRIVSAGENAILLLGRTDSVVKIEEKRVALNDVENRLFETGLVEDALVLALEDRRQYLAAAVVLNRSGRDRFHGRPKAEISRFFKGHLRSFFEPVVIPRRWRFPETLPRNSQGKIDRAAVMTIFDDAGHAAFSPALENTSALTEEPIVREKAEEANKLSLILVFPSHYLHFRGHFPGLPILPAVAQVDWAMKFARRAFGFPSAITEMPRFKCVKPIFPETAVRLELSYDPSRRRLSFAYSDPLDGSLYSQGVVFHAEAP